MERSRRFGREPASILGLGFYLPEAAKVRQLIAPTLWPPAQDRVWPQVRRARGDEHPAWMGARALRSAMDQAGARDLSFLISCGVSRDFTAPWSLAVDIAKQTDQGSTCVGIDITAGCVGTMVAIETACGLLSRTGSGAAAIVCAERWNETVDYGDAASQGLWGHSDGAGAIVIALGQQQRALARYMGTAFFADPELNGHIRIDHAGTRQRPANGRNAFRRISRQWNPRDLRERYMRGYRGAFTRLRQQFDCDVRSVVCNQLSPSFVSEIEEVLGCPGATPVCTGAEDGHMGGVDVLRGLQRLLEGGQLPGDVVAAASTTHTFAAALLKAAPR